MNADLAVTVPQNPANDAPMTYLGTKNSLELKDDESQPLTPQTGRTGPNNILSNMYATITIADEQKTEDTNPSVKDPTIASESDQPLPPQTRQRRKSILCPRVKGTKLEGGFFTKHLEFRIYLPITKEEISRSYQDFQWLHKKLLDAHGAAAYVPALPIPIATSKIGKEAVKDQIRALQEFIVDLYRHDHLYTDSSVEFFLSNQRINFSRARKSFIYIQTPMDILVDRNAPTNESAAGGRSPNKPSQAGRPGFAKLESNQNVLAEEEIDLELPGTVR